MKIMVIILFLFLTAQIFSKDSFKTDFIGRGKRKKPFKITYFHDDVPVGFLFVYKIPCSGSYVFYSVYVYPEHRNNGYGQACLNNACDYMKGFGAKRVYIQPGPFEIVDGRICFPDDETKKNNMEKLVRFYKRCGFKIAGKAIRKIAFIAYKVMKIDECSDFLMVKPLMENN